jgi:hypothetical protein
VIVSHDQAEKIYKQILEELEELWLLYADSEDEEEDGVDEPDDDKRDLVELMVEDGTERGIDEESLEKVFKAIALLGKKAQDA